MTERISTPDKKDHEAEVIIAQQKGKEKKGTNTTSTWERVDYLPISVQIRKRDKNQQIVKDPQGNDVFDLETGWETVARNDSGDYIVWKYGQNGRVEKWKIVDKQTLALQNTSAHLPTDATRTRHAVAEQASRVANIPLDAPRNNAHPAAPNALPTQGDVEHMAGKWVATIAQKMSNFTEKNWDRENAIRDSLGDAEESFKKSLLIRIGTNASEEIQKKASDTLGQFIITLSTELIAKKIITPPEYVEALKYMHLRTTKGLIFAGLKSARRLAMTIAGTWWAADQLIKFTQ